jgi:hypothetical protein
MWQVKVYFETLYNVIRRVPAFNQIPDFSSNGIQAKAKTLLDIEQGGTIVTDYLSYSVGHLHV